MREITVTKFDPMREMFQLNTHSNKHFHFSSIASMTMRIFKIQTVSKDDAEKKEKKDEEKLLFQTKQRQKQRNINEIKIKKKHKKRSLKTETK